MASCLLRADLRGPWGVSAAMPAPNRGEFCTGVMVLDAPAAVSLSEPNSDQTGGSRDPLQSRRGRLQPEDQSVRNPAGVGAHEHAAGVRPGGEQARNWRVVVV